MNEENRTLTKVNNNRKRGSSIGLSFGGAIEKKRRKERGR